MATSVTRFSTVNAPVGLVYCNIQRHFSRALHFDTERTKEGQENERKQDRRDESTFNDLSDSSTFGDFCDKHADERRPGDPPAPVKDGPTVHHPRRSGVVLLDGESRGRFDAGSLKELVAQGIFAPKQGFTFVFVPVIEFLVQLRPRAALEANLDHPRHVRANRLDEGVEEEPRVVANGNQDEQDQTNGESEQRQRFDTTFKTEKDGDRRDCGNNPDDAGLRLLVDFDGAVQTGENRVDLRDAQT